MKFLNNLFNWLTFGVFKIDNTPEHNEELKSHNDIIEDSYIDYDEWIRLEFEKAEAIKKCKGRKEKVVVLKKDGEEIAYGCNIYQLSINSKFPAKSLYRAYQGKRRYKNVYEVTNLE